MSLCPKVALLLGSLLLLPVVAHAQAAIAGAVRDTSGGVLPGVTVEAASPALIEKARTVVTDGAGQYRIENLRPGTYTITFRLEGFNTIRRDAIEMIGSATLSVNAEMRVGALQETLIVTGETPIVDVQSATRQAVVTGEVIKALPTAGGYSQIMQLAPGIVGGSQDIAVGVTATTFSAHGAFMAGRGNYDGRMMLDGLLISVPNGSATDAFVDTRNSAEITVTTSGGLGENDTAGPVLNIVPRTGANTLSVNVYADWMNKSLQGSNLSSELQAAGVRTPTPLRKNYDVNGAVGGPIVRDRLWYFVSSRKQYYFQDADMFFNKNAGDPTKWTYEPDFSRQSFTDREYHNLAARLTTQISPRNKLSVFWDETARCKSCENEHIALKSPEAGRRGEQWPIQTQQATLTSPITNKVLAEFAFGSYRGDWGTRSKQEPYTGDLIRIVEQCTAGCPVNGNIPGLTFRSQSNDLIDVGRNQNRAFSWRATLSHVSGSRTFKAGYTGNLIGDKRLWNITPNNLNYRVNNGVPNQLTMFINNYPQTTWMRADGFYVQEGWTRDRLTLQGALRLDIAQSWAPAQQVGPVRFMPVPLSFERTPIVDKYKDLTPRVAATYDLFGNGRTAIKASWGQYLESARSAGPYSVGNPTARIAQNVSRNWTDANNNWVPDCDLLSSVAQDLRATGGDVCGAFSDNRFGTSQFSNTVDPALLTGWGVRPSDKQLGLSVQQAVTSRIAVDIGYIRRSFKNFMVTDNLEVGPDDFDQFSIVAPQDSRLPNGGGHTISGLYNVKPALFGRTNSLVTLSDKYGDQYVIFNGVDLNVNARIRRDLMLQGGSNWGRTTSDNCEIRAKLPEIAPTDPYCHVVSGYLPYYKASATYVLPKADVQFGLTVVSRPGIQVLSTGTPVSGGQLAANYTVSSAVVAQSLGRPLSGGAANVTVNIVEPGVKYGDRVNELNLRIAKLVRLGPKMRTNLGIDVFNLINAGPVLSYNQAYIAGGSWLTPLSVMKARFFKLGAQFDF